jgi:hypothetical protein
MTLTLSLTFIVTPSVLLLTLVTSYGVDLDLMTLALDLYYGVSAWYCTVLVLFKKQRKRRYVI